LTAAASRLGRRLLSSASFQQGAARLIEQRVHGPGEEARRAGRTFVWARAGGPGGAEAQAWIETTDGYQFTAPAAVNAVEQVFEKQPVGATTPALAFGADFALTVEGTRRFDQLPAAAG
jgi:short subunit dehydrogenase-like uncharacterized protein